MRKKDFRRQKKVKEKEKRKRVVFTWHIEQCDVDFVQTDDGRCRDVQQVDARIVVRVDGTRKQTRLNRERDVAVAAVAALRTQWHVAFDDRHIVHFQRHGARTRIKVAVENARQHEQHLHNTMSDRHRIGERL